MASSHQLGGGEGRGNTSITSEQLLQHGELHNILSTSIALVCFSPMSRSKGVDGGVRNAGLSSLSPAGYTWIYDDLSSQENFLSVNRASHVWYQIIVLPYIPTRGTWD